jgi:hypothetical protein
LNAQRSFPKDDLDRIHTCVEDLLSLCENNLKRIEEAIPGLKIQETSLRKQRVAAFKSKLGTCRSAWGDAEARFAALLTETRMRVRQLSQLCRDLKVPTQEARDSYSKVGSDGIYFRTAPNVTVVCLD